MPQRVRQSEEMHCEHTMGERTTRATTTTTCYCCCCLCVGIQIIVKREFVFASQTNRLAEQKEKEKHVLGAIEMRIGE